MCWLFADLVGERSQQSVFRLDWTVASVQEQEASGAVGIFSFTHAEASLAHQRCLLITQVPRNRHVFEASQLRLAVHLAARGYAGQHGCGNPERVQDVFVPIECF